MYQSAQVTGDSNYVVQAGGNAIFLTSQVLVPIAQVDAPPGLDNLPLRPGRFVGRNREFERLDSVFTDADGRMVVQAVHGLGGIGKSTLAAEWAATRGDRHAPIRWITAASAVEVRQGLADLAAALQPILAVALSVEQLAERGLQWLSTHSGWLVVLDNVNDPADIAEVLARARTGRILITSRLSSGWQPGTTVVALDVLDPADAVTLLTSTITATRPRNLDGAAELCAALGFLPLAIEQSASYLAQSPATTPRAYLRLLSDYPAAMYARMAVGTAPERTLARVWRVTFDRIAQVEPFAVDLLLSLAWYAPDAIPAVLVDGSEPEDPPTVDAAVGVLAAYSMISPWIRSPLRSRCTGWYRRLPVRPTPATRTAVRARSRMHVPAPQPSWPTRYRTTTAILEHGRRGEA